MRKSVIAEFYGYESIETMQLHKGANLRTNTPLIKIVGGIFVMLVLTDVARANADQRFMKLFDRPVAIKTVKIPPEVPENAHLTHEVKCFIYSQFVVKVIDMGEVGASQLSVLKNGSKAKFDCVKGNQANEYVLKEWSGYFWGAKGPYAFFSAADGDLAGAMSFLVLDTEEQKVVFADSVASKAKTGPQFSAITVNKSGLELKYSRSYIAECSLKQKPEECEKWFVEKTGVAKGFAKKCLKTYKADPITPSAIVYDVVVPLSKTSPAYSVQLKDLIPEAQDRATPFVKTHSDVRECVGLM